MDTLIETIYFGGGTPSLLSGGEIREIVETIYSNSSVVEHPEITLETNPDDFTNEQVVREWINAGINRLSIGIQSFRDQDLEWMNRAHKAEEALKAVELARSAGINNITVDLIYGLPSMSTNEWESQIDQFLALNVPHLSAYCLTVEPRTLLSKRVEKGELNPANDEQQSEQFVVLLKKLGEAGYEQYEISNFAQPGWRSQHNSSYWSGKDYIGVGPSAHSYDGEKRRWNVSNNAAYMTGIETDQVYFEYEELTLNDRFNELVLTSLRKIEGLDLNALEKIHPIDPEFYHRVEHFIELRWAVWDKKSSRVILSDEGKLRADHIASELFIV